MTITEWGAALIIAAFVATAVLLSLVIDRIRHRVERGGRRWWE